MKLEDAYFIDEPKLVKYPFNLLSIWIADKFVAAIVDGEYCDVYLSKNGKNSWKIVGVFHSAGEQLNLRHLEKLILKHKRLRLPLLIEG
ncbi:hypothetical protein [Neobacillus sp. SuZ13]|uniref:hypothetical protein n=1 Tax=Neobacillus sp. SuZ13 TaxID=3047875 RepID=UPI0024C078C9|nr:hypothetical protein [Neobacillus sp. SuZ13]WHY65380.1 hypothetical protein QNH17_20115 [Neobacillus sp. SuZ13]